MKRIITIICTLALVVLCAVPAFATTLESSVTSGDTITDTYVFPAREIAYETISGSGLVSGSEFTESLAEGDWANLECYYDSLDLTDIIGDDYIASSAIAEIEFSIIGGIDYTIGVLFGNGSGFFPENASGSDEVYESNELCTITVELDLSDAEWIEPEVYIDVYSFSSNFYVKFHDIKISIVKNRVDRYEPEPVAPDGSGVVDDVNKGEQEVLDKIEDGETAAEDVMLSVIDKLMLYTAGFGVFSSIFEMFSTLAFVDVLLSVSLALGLFALLFGAVAQVIKGKE